MALDASQRRRLLKALVLPAIGILLLLAALPWVLQGEAADPDANVPNPVVTSTQWTLKVPALNVNAPLVGIEATSSRTLDPPRNPQQVGWWKQSAKPGAKGGQTIVTGHTVHTGGGQFDHIGDAKRGAAVEIIDGNAHRIYRFTVDRVVTLSKEQVDQQAETLFAQKNPHNVLVLITCTGWDGHVYHSNVFVYATPVAAPSGAAA